jgi:hypothetical protein
MLHADLSTTATTTTANLIAYSTFASLMQINLSSTGLEEDAGASAGLLLRNKTAAITSLSLQHNALGRRGVNDVFWALRRNASCTKLDLSDNKASHMFNSLKLFMRDGLRQH